MLVSEVGDGMWVVQPIEVSLTALAQGTVLSELTELENCGDTKISCNSRAILVLE